MGNKKLWIWAVVGLALAIAITVAPWLGNFRNHAMSNDPAHWGQFGDYIGGVLATVLAAFSFAGLLYTVWVQDNHMRKDKEMREDEVYLNHAISCLERAFNALQREGVDGPVRGRAMWLTSARWLLNAEKSAQMIRNKGVKLLYEGTAEDWRNRFRIFLNPDAYGHTYVPSFFEPMNHDIGMEPNSIYVVYSFLDWPESRGDEIDDVGEWDMNKISQRYAGAKAFLEEQQRILNSL
ncbi:hypothetical protein ID144_02815 [Pseudomonas sp. JM0905a]|uniref:hypothetical protein n=1 Tax=Pseudomonas sp. JM0905a TaxID=2772484 RepID=UPI001688C3C0|nr:hypothetical protein [Pseudomonas sp. JM0905a]MBD2835971.1 hypothetical protein [Pseudomonas sp. JM0905a]